MSEDFNFNTLIALGALIIAAAAMFAKMMDKSLSIREHEVFKGGVDARLSELSSGLDERLEIREFSEWREVVTRDFDRLEGDLKIIETTRPTSGELEMASRAVSARLSVIEEMVKEMGLNNKRPTSNN
jgi:hypothetical protein